MEEGNVSSITTRSGRLSQRSNWLNDFIEEENSELESNESDEENEETETESDDSGLIKIFLIF